MKSNEILYKILDLQIMFVFRRLVVLESHFQMTTIRSNRGVVSRLGGAYTLQLATVPTSPMVLPLANFSYFPFCLALWAFDFVIIGGGIRE